MSDLHLFTKRSVAHHYMERIHDAAEQADFFVLNGDIVDFRWTVLESVEETGRQAIEWLDRMCTDFPHCRFFYVLGNHDGFQFFADMLVELAERRENFDWHPSHFRIGRALFLHGDLPIRNRDADPFVRDMPQTDKRWHSVWDVAYHAFVGIRLHRLIARVHWSPDKCARRIVRALKQDHQGLAAGVTDIYFGHVHRAFEDHAFNGVIFHNTGAAIQHLELNLINVRT